MAVAGGMAWTSAMGQHDWLAGPPKTRPHTYQTPAQLRVRKDILGDPRKKIFCLQSEFSHFLVLYKCIYNLYYTDK